MLRFFFFFNDTATTEIYTLSLHDALPIFRRAGVDAARCRAAAGRRRLRRPHGAGLATAPGTGPVTAPDPAGEQRIRVVVATDRKSTRLNSSHANISYAVFCLKKNKTYAT